MDDLKTLSEKRLNGIDVCNAVRRYLRNPHLPSGKGQKGQKLVCQMPVNGKRAAFYAAGMKKNRVYACRQKKAAAY